MNDQEHQLILNWGMHLYREAEQEGYDKQSTEAKAQRLINRLWEPWDGLEAEYQDKPHGIMHPVTRDLVADMFWQGFYFAESEANSLPDYEDEL